MEEYGPWWKWFLGILRVTCLGIVSCSHLGFLFKMTDLLQTFLKILRVLISIACSLSLLRIHLFQGKECTQLVNRFLELFQRVQSLCKREQKGYGGAHELVLLLLMLLTQIHEIFFLSLVFFIKIPLLNSHIWMADTIICIGSKFLLHIAVMGYLTLGLLYADLNDYVRTELRSQLEQLEEQPTRRRLRKARQSLDACLTLYKDLQSLTSLFQRIYDLPLLLSLIRSCVGVALISYGTFILLEISSFWHWTLISFGIFGILLLTLSVQRALLQFGAIHRLTLENSYLSEDKEWHTTVSSLVPGINCTIFDIYFPQLEVFFNHLNLYELRVCPLGLFNISNELLVVFLSALVTYITVIIQYAMQMEALSSSLSNRLGYNPF